MSTRDIITRTESAQHVIHELLGAGHVTDTQLAQVVGVKEVDLALADRIETTISPDVVTVTVHLPEVDTEALAHDIRELWRGIEHPNEDEGDLSAADQCAVLYEIMGRHGMPVS